MGNQGNCLHVFESPPSDGTTEPARMLPSGEKETNCAWIVTKKVHFIFLGVEIDY